MDLENKTLGEIKVDNSVIGTLAKNAALQVEGVAGIVPESVMKKIFGIWGKGEAVKGVIITNPDEYSVCVTLQIIVFYGYNVLDVARKIQVRVRSAIKSFANLEVDGINVIIQEIAFQDDTNSLPNQHSGDRVNTTSSPEKGEKR